LGAPIRGKALAPQHDLQLRVWRRRRARNARAAAPLGERSEPSKRLD
jgi:hypothetical protein